MKKFYEEAGVKTARYHLTSTLEEGLKFCTYCGAPVAAPAPTIRKCPGCGAEAPEGGAFCVECGTKL